MVAKKSGGSQRVKTPKLTESARLAKEAARRLKAEEKIHLKAKAALERDIQFSLSHLTARGIALNEAIIADINNLANSDARAREKAISNLIECKDDVFLKYRDNVIRDSAKFLSFLLKQDSSAKVRIGAAKLLSTLLFDQAWKPLSASALGDRNPSVRLVSASYFYNLLIPQIRRGRVGRDVARMLAEKLEKAVKLEKSEPVLAYLISILVRIRLATKGSIRFLNKELKSGRALFLPCYEFESFPFSLPEDYAVGVVPSLVYILKSRAFNHVVGLLQSSNPNARVYAASMFEDWARYGRLGKNGILKAVGILERAVGREGDGHIKDRMESYLKSLKIVGRHY